jgi:uncharacterized protein
MMLTQAAGNPATTRERRRARSIWLCVLAGWLLASTFVGAAPLPARLVDAAAAQIGVTTSYDPSYQRLDYPGGDVPIETGVCTDVVIRAYRALGVDLQVLLHEDIRGAWSDYPKLWSAAAPDRNIDHRRAPNLRAFFARHGLALTPSRDAADYLPGDIVTWRLPSGVPHIGIVGCTPGHAAPMVIHNIGGGTREEDVLFAYTITGHYRFPAVDARHSDAPASEHRR